MGSKMISRAKTFYNILRSLQDEEEGSNPCNILEEDMQILKMKGDQLSVINMYCANQPVLICEKAIPKTTEVEDQKSETSTCSDEGDDNGVEVNGEIEHQTVLDPQPLTVMKARQLLSWYTLSQNPNVSAVGNGPALLPLWVRCDMSDPDGTTWLGAETICISNKVSGIKLYSVTCKGSTVDKRLFLSLDDIKQEHKRRHHPSSMNLKGSARFILFGSTVVENSLIESQSSVTADLKWNHMETILETPPLSASATLNIKVSCGDMRSPMFEMYRELDFLQALANGLRTGETEWVEPLDSTSPVDLTKAFLEEVQSTTKKLQEKVSRPVETTNPDPETDPPIFKSVLIRGDLDFVEQLWVLMRKSVMSYQDIGDCLKLVIDALKFDSQRQQQFSQQAHHAVVPSADRIMCPSQESPL
ncbi:hypothetical protein fugu_011688 [Takifugu bimaculatus]|uniref:Protein zwilch n=1 Tax=Takifugu bimaculatus TaxID=433685 RepID=A0A4Z2C891_9TELE|nr:hypothetical protein fugu_011688 [Takifugu bimaculatus]